MEHSLQDRDRVGVSDFVLLEDFTNIDAFVDNLRKRHKENHIYTSIGHVLISVNPYKEIANLYTDDVIRQYRSAGYIETPPHVFGVANLAYRSLTEENRGQCILISGESGAGKTEASKKVLQFVSEAAGRVGTVKVVKDKLLKSNPVLEAFGNAKTNKNDNSSRFGKYMDIAFDYKGDPVGGNILNYLLEKSRVVDQSAGERNFHIFYQLLAGADETLLEKLALARQEAAYGYLKHYNHSQPSNDAEQFKVVCQALEAMELSSNEQDDMFKIVASILHLGNVQFEKDESGVAVISDSSAVGDVSSLLGCNEKTLAEALTSRTIDAHGDKVCSPLNVESATYARDALAKNIYDRLFTWLVGRLNQSLEPPNKETSVIGILDIYGFEVFGRNGFEQFCINLCNEKLQQLFINLTLKHEQEEYEKEGIEWVQVEFFNNKIICDMFEQRHKGIISMMDEECLRPGNPTDFSLLAKMNKNLSTHAHYCGHEMSDAKTQKEMGRDEFRIRHYAGDVTYSVENFLDKNKDLLFRDLCYVMTTTTNSITKVVFTNAELNHLKRPDTAMSKYQRSLNELMVILSNKEPSYIRCIRPNDTKSSVVFDEDTVRHQVKYLGLMENLRVRRAGFAYRRPYEDFLHRYKCLSKKTWPNYKGPAKEGVKTLVNDLGFTDEEYRMGKTKLFIRSPTTLFKTEDAFQAKKHDIATIIQKMWKGRQERLSYLKKKTAAITMERIVRGFLARKEAERRKKAVVAIRRFIMGFLTRNGPETDINKKFVAIAKKLWLTRLSEHLPKSVLDNTWPVCPYSCEEASKQLQALHKRHMVRVYRRKLSAEREKDFRLKVLAEEVFKDKKKSYPATFPQWFKTSRMDSLSQPCLDRFIQTQINGEKVLYSTTVKKFDRHGKKSRQRIAVVTNKYFYLVDTKTNKPKHKMEHNGITELGVTSNKDNFLIVRIKPELKKDKGDLLLLVEHAIEMATIMVDFLGNKSLIKISEDGNIPYNIIKDPPGTIEISSAPTPWVSKKSSANLVVQG